MNVWIHCPYPDCPRSDCAPLEIYFHMWVIHKNQLSGEAWRRGGEKDASQADIDAIMVAGLMRAMGE